MAILDELLDEDELTEEEELLLIESPVTTITPAADPLAVPASDADILADELDEPTDLEDPAFDEPVDTGTEIDATITETVEGLIPEPGTLDEPDEFDPDDPRDIDDIDITPVDPPVDDGTTEIPDPPPDPFGNGEEGTIDLPDEPPDLDDTFGPGDTLIDNEILPEDSERLQGINDLIDQLIAGFEEFGEFSVGTDTAEVRNALTALLGEFAGLEDFSTGEDTDAFRDILSTIFGEFGELGTFESDAGGTTDLLTQLLGGVLESPDRFELAQRQLDEFIERGEPGFQKRLQNVGRKAATLGRLNSGITTSELGDVALQRERDIGLERERLLTNALQQSLDDALKQLGITSNIQGQLFGQDLATRDQIVGELLQQLGIAGDIQGQLFGQDVAAQQLDINQLLSEAGLTTDVLGQLFGQDITERGIEFGETTQVFDLLEDLQGTTFDQEAVQRAEERIEREFQVDQSQQALQNAILQILLEEDLLDRAFARELQEAQLLGDLGGL